jgi:hypothetical protein
VPSKSGGATEAPKAAEPPTGETKAAAPEVPREKDRERKRLKPVKVVNVPKTEQSPARPAVARGPMPVQTGKLPPEKTTDEDRPDDRERVLMAAGFVSHQKPARIGGGDDVVFRCPVCSAQNQCVVGDCGSEFSCSDCGAVLLLPEIDRGDRIRVLSLPKKRAGAADLPPLQLPGERSSEGPSGEARFQAVEELLPDSEDGGLEWGLENRQMRPEKRRRAATWVWFAAPVFLICAAVLIRQIFATAGRAGASPEQPGESALATPAGDIDWDTLPATRKYLLVDRTLRAYLDAPDLPAKAALSRGGAASLDRMTAYYQRKGAYEAETRAQGAVQDILLQEETTVGGKVFQLAVVRFAESTRGIYALERTPGGYLVDWEYAEGYGEMGFAEMNENPPEKPVLLRVHLSETTYFADGFDEASYRAFNMADPFKEQTLLVFARRHSEVEEALARAWNDAVLDSIGDPTGSGQGELDFVVRVRHENESNRRGFVIDEVLTRGWIVPYESK